MLIQYYSLNPKQFYRGLAFMLLLSNVACLFYIKLLVTEISELHEMIFVLQSQIIEANNELALIKRAFAESLMSETPLTETSNKGLFILTICIIFCLGFMCSQWDIKAYYGEDFRLAYLPDDYIAFAKATTVDSIVDTSKIPAHVREYIHLSLQSIKQMTQIVPNEQTSIVSFIVNKIQFTINSIGTDNSDVSSMLDKIKAFGVKWWGSKK